VTLLGHRSKLTNPVKESFVGISIQPKRPA